MKQTLIILLAAGFVIVSSAALGGERVGVADIKISFANSLTNPPPALNTVLPRHPQSDWDAIDHGPLTNIVAGRIAALTVTWLDPKPFESKKQSAEFLRELLSSANTHMWRFHIWSSGEDHLAVVATVDHTVGKQGKWLIWFWPGIVWAYQDGDGKWWWGSWDAQKMPKPKSLEAGKK